MTQEVTPIQPVKKETVPLKFVPFNKVFDHMNQVHDSISRLAYELFERNGRVFGHDLEDWLKAESEVLHPVHINISESDNALVVHAELPGFSANEVEVSLEPWRLTISGKREIKDERRTAKTIYSEHCLDKIFRVINLPAEVDTTKVTATMKDGLLELGMRKTEKVQVKTKAA